MAASMGFSEGTLGKWVRSYKSEHPETEAEKRGAMEWARFEELQREMAEMKREKEFLKSFQRLLLEF